MLAGWRQREQAPVSVLALLPASCRQNGTMRHATVCRQDAGSTFGVTFRPLLNTYKLAQPRSARPDSQMADVALHPESPERKITAALLTRGLWGWQSPSPLKLPQ